MEVHAEQIVFAAVTELAAKPKPRNLYSSGNTCNGLDPAGSLDLRLCKELYSYHVAELHLENSLNT